MKHKETAVIIKQEALSDGIFSLWLETEAATLAKPGQFLSLYPKNAARLLPRPISICETDKINGKSAIRLVYRVVGGGTAEFSTFKPGETIDFLGPLGNGFPENAGRALLIGGGIGIPPMLMLAKSRAAREQSSREDTLIVTGYRDNNTFLLSELSRYGTVYGAAEQLCADLFTDRALRNELLFIPIRSARQTESFPLDGASDREQTGAVPFTEGTVLDAIKAFELSADVIYACGPKPMLKAVKDFALEKGIPAWLSLEERMACGVGVCLGCVCETAEPDPHSLVTNKRVCREGPVFAAEEVIL